MPLALLLLLQLLLTDHLVNVQIREECVELVVVRVIDLSVVGTEVGHMSGPVRSLRLSLWLVPLWSVSVRR